MKLLTKEIKRKLEKHPLYSQDGKGMDAEVLVKFFNPYGLGTWLVTEGNKTEDGDWELFGYCHIYEWEWGYFMLSELESIKAFGYPAIERDRYMGNRKTVRECVND